MFAIKRVISLLCVLVLMLCIVPQPTYAANEVFVATNNMILPLTDAMPIKSGNTWYVDYQCFTSGDLKVNSSYNSDSRTLVLYTWDTTLVFNLDEYTAYNTTDNISHPQIAFSSHGTFYVPAQFTASQLGFSFSYIESASCIRFRSTSNLSDSMFAYIVKNKIPDLIAQYNASKAPADNSNSSSSGSEQSSDSAEGSSGSTDSEEKVTVQKRVYLVFDITGGKNNNAILDALSRYRLSATFFLTGDTMKDNDDSIRRMMILGHSFGIRGFSGDSSEFANVDTMTESLSRTNDLLYEIARTKARLVRVPGGSRTNLSSQCADALISGGYRYWDQTIDANGGRTSPSAARIANTVINGLEKRTWAVIAFTDSDQTVSALPRIFKYLNDNNCVVSTLSVLDTPSNQRSDTR